MKSLQPLSKGTRSARPRKRLPYSYAFVMNVRTLQGAASFELASGHELRRATAREIGEIKETLKTLSGFTHPFVQHLWECEWPCSIGQARLGPPRLLPEAEWRYFVIAFRGSNAAFVELQPAFDLATVELEIAFTATRSEFVRLGLSFHPDRLSQLLKRAAVRQPVLCGHRQRSSCRD